MCKNAKQCFQAIKPLSNKFLKNKVNLMVHPHVIHSTCIKS